MGLIISRLVDILSNLKVRSPAVMYRVYRYRDKVNAGLPVCVPVLWSNLALHIQGSTSSPHIWQPGGVCSSQLLCICSSRRVHHLRVSFI